MADRSTLRRGNADSVQIAMICKIGTVSVDGEGRAKRLHLYARSPVAVRRPSSRVRVEEILERPRHGSSLRTASPSYYIVGHSLAYRERKMLCTKIGTYPKIYKR